MTHMTRAQYKATLDSHQRQVLADQIWMARDGIIDCKMRLIELGADDEILRRLQIAINDMQDIAQKQGMPSLEAYKAEDAIHDEHLAEETDEEHQLDVNMIRYAGAIT
jgi:hypothetical protein